MVNFMNFISTQNPKRADYLRWGLSLLVILGVVSSAVFGYRWYITKRETAAHKTLSECMYAYAKAQVGQEKWLNVEQLCTTAYEKHSSSYIAPYFIALQAETALQQNNLAQAVILFEKALSNMSRTSPLYGLYAVKRALVELDDEGQAQRGLQHLQALADDTNNINRDMALYYLGLYHWMHNDTQAARVAWQTLKSLQSAEQQQAHRGMSSWVALAEAKLQQSA